MTRETELGGAQALAEPAYRRSYETWLCYALIGHYAFVVNLLGPATPFLQRELDLSYTATSLHASGLALGIITTGLVGVRFVARWERSRALWLGGYGVVGACLTLAGSRALATSVPSTFAIGLFGALMIVVAQALLADRGGERAEKVLMEANFGASLCTIAAPLLIALCAGLPLGWRGAFVIAALSFLPLAIALRRLPGVVPPTQKPAAQPRTRLPTVYWAYWTLLVLVGSIEFAIIFWASGFLVVQHGWSAPAAAAGLTLFFGLMAVGRLVGALLLGRASGRWLLFGALAITLLGTLGCWASSNGVASILGLALAGLGVANLYPLILGQALRTAPALADRASVRAALASGAAILLAPFLLGALADQLGIGLAFGLIPLLTLFALGLLAVVRRSASEAGTTPIDAVRRF